ncbi:MAG: hypothetical protein GY707_05380 [Desulfobacteraceae bacterium]|nr:hypothetical protein [Desulfobacteraceae bacterium]
MKSRILAREIIVQKHKHRTADVYYPAAFIDQSGRDHQLLFSVYDIEKAQKVARNKKISNAKHRKWWHFW